VWAKWTRHHSSLPSISNTQHPKHHLINIFPHLSPTNINFNSTRPLSSSLVANNCYYCRRPPVARRHSSCLIHHHHRGVPPTFRFIPTPRGRVASLISLIRISSTILIMSRPIQDQFIDDDDEEEVCPLCVEELDLTDKNFRPCPCGYQVGSADLCRALHPLTG
jgi:hypothetical protein